MSHEVRSRFRVKDVVESQGDIWLEDLHPQRSGLLVAVEMNAQYESGLEEKVRNLDEGDILIASLKSQDKRHTVWHFSEVIEESNERSSQVPA